MFNVQYWSQTLQVMHNYAKTFLTNKMIFESSICLAGGLLLDWRGVGSGPGYASSSESSEEELKINSGVEHLDGLTSWRIILLTW